MLRQCTLCLLLLCAVQAQATTPDNTLWNALLARHVRTLPSAGGTAVDYAGIAREREQLDSYLAQLSRVSRDEFDTWPKPDQLAFLINAYNAWTVQLILSAYPELESIRDLGSFLRSPWKKSFIPLLGEERSLDDIEHGLIRGSGRYGEPRIHFAVNCASIGCPALRSEAYQGANIDRQLEEQTRQFLGDRSRNRLVGDSLQVSSLFKWYGDDFTAGWRDADSLAEFFALYAGALDLDDETAKRLLGGAIDIEFLAYDWRLNDAP